MLPELDFGAKQNAREQLILTVMRDGHLCNKTYGRDGDLSRETHCQVRLQSYQWFDLHFLP